MVTSSIAVLIAATGISEAGQAMNRPAREARTVPLAVAQSASAKAASREHFAKGVAAFDAKRFGEAADEFAAAYRLSPAFAVLYNIGQVNVALGKSVEAVDSYEKYLRQGASAIPVERRQKIEEEVERQRARIGTIAVRTAPEGAEVRLDGVLVGTTPLGNPARVTAGRHTVEANLKDHGQQVREIDVAGRADIVLELRLEPIAAAALPPAANPSAPTAAPAPAPPPIVAVAIAAPAPVYTPDHAQPASKPAFAAEPARPEPALEHPGPVIGNIVIQSPHPEGSGSTSSVNWQRIAGVVVTVGGVALATWGGILVYRGITQTNDARDRLNQEVALGAPDDKVWDKDIADFNAGKSLSQKGWILGGVGGGALLGGIILMATAPGGRGDVAIGPWLTAGGSGLSAWSAW